MLNLARRARDDAYDIFRKLQLRSALSDLSKELSARRPPQGTLARRLVHGWGNESFAAKPALVQAILEWIPRTRGPIVECGSGLSTLVLATAATHFNRHIYTLENDASWAALVMKRMPIHHKSRVSISVAPLKNYGEFDWYPTRELPESIGYVVCDGPPGTTRGGRYGLAPVIGSRLAPGSVILLDDTQRSEEHAIIRRWCKELQAQIVQEESTFTVIRVGNTDADALG